MNSKRLIIGFAVMLVFSIALSSCASRKKHHNCHCPSFSQVNHSNYEQGKV